MKGDGSLLKDKIAVQLYTLREECHADFPGVLRKISQIGYGGVQFAGFQGYDPQELKAVLDEVGLKTAGMHVGFHDIVANTGKVVSDARLFDTRDIICPSIPAELRNEGGYKQLKKDLNGIAKHLKGEGFRISYHNHAFEFETVIEGQNALSYLLEAAVDNEILAELDVYWLQKCGLEPVTFFKPYADRMPIVHMKDMTADGEQAFAEIGTGSIEFEPIIRWGEENGVEWYVVEQDVCRTAPMDCVQTSFTNLYNLMSNLQPNLFGEA